MALRAHLRVDFRASAQVLLRERHGIRGLPGMPRAYEAVDFSAGPEYERLLRDLRAPESLQLKVGAQVMILRNITVETVEAASAADLGDEKNKDSSDLVTLANGMMGRVVALCDNEIHVTVTGASCGGASGGNEVDVPSAGALRWTGRRGRTLAAAAYAVLIDVRSHASGG